MENQSTELNELFCALSKAQDEFRVASKDSSNPFFKSKYANLQAIIEAARPSLCKNGLAVAQQIISEEGTDYLITILGHSSGQWISSKMRIAPMKTDIQSLGSYITYLRRYSYATLVGVYDGDDDDGEGAVMRDELVTQKQAEKLEHELRKQNKLEETLSYFKVSSISKLKQSEAQRLFQRLGISSHFN